MATGRTVWRHRLAVLPVLLLSVLGCVYVLVLANPVYEAHTSYVLINPPGPPSAAQIDKNPSLGNVNADNPYTRFSDQSVVVNILAASVDSNTTRTALAAEGVDKNYQVAPSNKFGATGPLIEVTGVGSTPGQAVLSAQQVSAEVERTLHDIQQAQGVDGRYMIKAEQVERADTAQLRASARLRSLVAVVGAGVLLTFVVVSVAEAVDRRRSPGLRGRNEDRVTLPAASPNAEPGGSRSVARTSLAVPRDSANGAARAPVRQA